MNAAGVIFIAAVLILPWVVIFTYLFFINRNIVKNYNSFSLKYGFEVDLTQKSGLFRHPVSYGEYRGIPVEICSFIKEEGKKKSSATYINADCGNLAGFDFLIVRRNNANDSAYGGKGCKINDSEFDSKFIIITNDSARMFDLLNFSIKYKLQQLLNVGFKGELQLNGTKLRYEEKELIKGSMNLLRIEILLHLLCEIAVELKETKEFK